jgi:hypothetical protein
LIDEHATYYQRPIGISRVPVRGGHVKNLGGVQEAIALPNKLIQALLSRLCQQKGQRIRRWLAYKMF